MYKVYFKNKLIIKIDNKDEIQNRIDEYIRKIEQRNYLYVSKLKEIESILEDIYPRRDKDTNEEYIEFLKKTNMEFIKSLEAFGKEFFKENFERIMVLNPTKTETGWVYKTKNDFGKDILNIKNINSLKIELINEIPIKSKLEIIEE